MKFLKRISFFLLLLVLFNACNKDEEPLSATYLNLIGTWSATRIEYGVTIDGTSFIQYYINALGYTEEEAKDLLELFGQSLASGFFGTLEFKNDNTYIAKFGGGIVNGTWELVNSDQQINLTEDGFPEVQEIEIRSVSETTLVVAFDEMDADDLDGDGTDEDITIGLTLTLDKQ